MKKTAFLAVLMTVLLFPACQQSADNEIASNDKEFKVDFEKFTLDNGLQVIFHIDRSDPVVAVALTAHVGSAREVENRTGFAHLFEHLLFLESENLGKGGLDKMSARIGGSGANGSTNRDRTNYFQTVPNDALEKMIWAEADKLGYFINTVTDPVLAKEKQVVKNEKRQGVDNRPYGHTSSVIHSNLYPKDHPYNWEVIGSLEDLQNATLKDVKDFFNSWYVPNNVTLTIAGDFDTEQARAWVKKYFDEIPRGPEISKMEKRPVSLTESKKLYYEDNFARLPQLTLTWPGVYQYHPDSYPLSVLVQYLSRGKQAPMYKKLVEEQQLSDNVNFFQYNSELAGQLMLRVTAFDGKSLDAVAAGIQEAMNEFEANGISQADLDRIKAGQETNFYNGLSSVLGKGFQLAQYEIFAGDPGFINQDVKNILEVTTEDVMRVYNTYLKDKHYIATSFVPQGQASLVLSGSSLAEVVEEKIVQGAEETFDPSLAAEYERTPSSFDRSVEPPYGPSPVIGTPEVWRSDMASGIRVMGIENNEVPLVQFEIQIDGGLLLEDQGKIGVSNMLAQMMTRGTASKTPAQLEQAIEALGASIGAYSTDYSLVISANCLSKNFPATVELVREILLEPRWDEKELELLRQSVISQLQRQQANPNAIASNEYAQLLFGEGHILANNNLGSLESVPNISMEDLKQYYTTFLSPSVSKLHIVGDVNQDDVMTAFEGIDANWTPKTVDIPAVPEMPAVTVSKVYFYDVPGAKQSVLNFGYPALKITDPDYYPAFVMNYRLGGGGFASQFTQQLREGKGYTYGIRSRFSGSNYGGSFTVSSGVRSNVTFESADLVKEIMSNYAEGLTESDLEITQGFMIKSSARSFETINSKLNMIRNISNYGFSDAYASERIAYVQGLTLDELQGLARTHIKPDQMIYLVVGDAATQFERLRELGYGEPILLNRP
ncbi:M16 family metallopeptidase [Aureitalea marina]|uniref:Peptidase M16 n=1 Tax=Aureitalea marina TaxID=930804 RepID=A0A2S7KNH8_9FLAO|nr:pitrilysin family protein [Aureitalea marina]PQB04184.1 peptidase M16 [Aureitalea marina]